MSMVILDIMKVLAHVHFLCICVTPFANHLTAKQKYAQVTMMMSEH